MRKTIVAAITAASAATAACGHNRTIDAGPTVSRNYQVGNFQEIEVAGPYDVDVRTGPTVAVSASGGEKLLEKTVVEVRGDKLVIGPKEHGGLFHWGWTSNGKAKFTVTVPQLTGATIAGSGNIHVDQVQGNRFEGTVAGSGGLGVDKLNLQSLKFAIAGSGGVKAGPGKAQSAEYEIAGSGDIDAGAIAVTDAKASIAGSGNIRAHATGAADVSIMGSGDVSVTGGAKCSIHRAGSGNVSCS